MKNHVWEIAEHLLCENGLLKRYEEYETKVSPQLLPNTGNGALLSYFDTKMNILKDFLLVSKAVTPEIRQEFAHCI